MDFGMIRIFLILMFSVFILSSLSSSLAQTTNSPPVLEPIGLQTEDENDSAILTISATDPDQNDILTFKSSNLPRFAMLIDNGDRSAELRLETSLNDQGTYSVTITVTDNGSPQLSDSETFTLIINDDGDPPSADEFIQKSIDEINTMVLEGKFNDGQANSLIEKLEAAAQKITSGDNSAGEKILKAFINQVEAFIKSGILTPADGQLLIDDIQIILNTVL